MKKEEKFDIIKFLIVLGICMMILSMFCRCTTQKSYLLQNIETDTSVKQIPLCLPTLYGCMIA